MRIEPVFIPVKVIEWLGRLQNFMHRVGIEHFAKVLLEILVQRDVVADGGQIDPGANVPRNPPAVLVTRAKHPFPDEIAAERTAKRKEQVDLRTTVLYMVQFPQGVKSDNRPQAVTNDTDWHLLAPCFRHRIDQQSACLFRQAMVILEVSIRLLQRVFHMRIRNQIDEPGHAIGDAIEQTQETLVPGAGSADITLVRGGPLPYQVDPWQIGPDILRFGVENTVPAQEPKDLRFARQFPRQLGVSPSTPL